MSQDAHDIEWRCGCGHTNPDFDERCNGCGQYRYPRDPESNGLPYPWCYQPDICKNLGSCPRDPNCGE